MCAQSYAGDFEAKRCFQCQGFNGKKCFGKNSPYRGKKVVRLHTCHKYVPKRNKGD